MKLDSYCMKYSYMINYTMAEVEIAYVQIYTAYNATFRMLQLVLSTHLITLFIQNIQGLSLPILKQHPRNVGYIRV